MGIEAGEECGAGGAAAGRVVELGEADALGGQLANIGGGHFAAVALEVGEAHVVDEDDDDVGAVGLLWRRQWGGSGKEQRGGAGERRREVRSFEFHLPVEGVRS